MMKKILEQKGLLSSAVNTKKVILLFLILFTFTLSESQVVINEVQETGSVELKNLGSTTVDISNYWLCDFPSYRRLNNLNLVSGSLNIPAGGLVVVDNFNFIDSADGELGLYTTNSFGSAAALEDYIEWGSSGHGRSGVAVAAGIWTSGAFIPAFAPNLSLQYTGTGNSPASYYEASETLGSENTGPCMANAGNITINNTGLNNTTTVASDGLSAVICVDNQPDFIDVTVGSGSVGTNFGYIITDAASNVILALPSSGPFDLNGAGIGTCEIWYVRYESDFGGNIVGNNLSNLTGCFDLSNPVQVIREAADGGTVAIDLTATGNPNNTTSFNGTNEAVICIDSQPDPLVITHSNPLATNLSYRYVITNEDSSVILAISASATIDLNGAGVGTCKIWGWSYRGMADNGTSFIGGTLAALQAADCSDISDNSVTVIREAADGGTVAIDVANTDLAGGTTTIVDPNNATIITNDGIANPIVVTHSNPLAQNLSYRYVITDASNDQILNIVASNTIDLEGVFPGTCQIWGWSYRGMADNGVSFIGQPLANLQAADCSDISSNAVTVVRNAFNTPTNFTATLSGTQENPAALTTAYGSINASLNGNTLTVSGSFNGLTSDFDANVAGGAHIHKAIAGRNGGVELLLNTTVAADLRSGVYDAVNNTFTLTNDQLAALQARELYVNIHSVNFPGGEIRGQILPNASSYYQANLLGSNEVPSISTEASGNLVFELDGSVLTVSGSFDDLAGDVAVSIAGGAHIHDAVAGRNSGVVFVLNLTLDTDNRGAIIEAANNSFTLNAAQIATLMEQGNYINIHSTAFMAGELRGQVTPISSSIFRADLTGAQEVPAINSAATGRIVLTHDGLGNVTVSGSFNNLTGDLNTALAGGIHLHAGVAGTNAAVDFVINPTVAADNRNAVILPANNTFTFSSMQIETLLKRGYYVNVHSLQFPAGELRGQVLPRANTYLGTNLAGDNEIQPVVTAAVGNLQFEITGDQLVVTGGFSGLDGDFDATVAGGSHLHTGDAANNGGVTILLNATVATDLKSGVYNAADNTFTIDAAQKTSLLNGGIYVNIHTTTNAPGELRGQVLRDDNAFPAATAITSPADNAAVTVDNDLNTPFTVNWNAVTDANQDLVVYTFQLATDAAFTNLLVNDKVGTGLSFNSNNQDINALLASEGVALGGTITLYHRVLSSDGSVSSISPAFTIMLTRDATASVDDFTNNFDVTVYPNPSSDFVTIQSNSNESSDMKIELYDMTGKSIYTTQDSLRDTVTLDITSLTSGVYLINITDQNNNSSITKRIMKR